MSYPKTLVLAIASFFGLGIFVLIVELVVNGLIQPSLLPYATGGAIAGVNSIVPVLRAVYVILFIALLAFLVILLFKREGEEYYV